jgi:predicted nucleic acid-binding protein
VSLVVDASVVVAVLVDSSAAGQWAEQLLVDQHLFAPSLMPVEVTNVLRRLESNGTLDTTAASLAFADLGRLAWEDVPFGPCAARVWELRSNLTAYDAWYVAAAEGLGVPLASLDSRLANSAGPTCRIVTP